MYKILDSKPNPTSSYYDNLVDIKNIEVENLNQLIVINDQNETIVGISFSIYRVGFDEIFDVLNEKYKLIRSDSPLVGDKYVEFQGDNCLITMDSPHMKSSMIVAYYDLEFFNKVSSRLKQEQKDQEQQNKKNF